MDPHVALLVQIALILGLARLLGECMRSLNQPPVLGELLAGVCLGPSLFGWLWPGGFEAVFGVDTQGNRPGLDSLSRLGLVLLMLLTGLETDIRLMKSMGRAAFMASAFGLLIPFGCGFVLGQFLDASFVPQTGGRLVLCLFLATAMAVSAMPVIAKILIDLGVMKRNFGVLSLSAAVVDDTVGWIVLAVIAGLATGGKLELSSVGATLGWLTLFCLVAALVLYPALKWALPRLEHYLLIPGGELVFVVTVALLCGAATEWMHVHAVFGAFVAGLIFRQCPSLSRETLHKLEGITFALFAPIFFGVIGLEVRLGALGGAGLTLIVLAVAIFGKVLGCIVGGRLGRLSMLESLALGAAMSARGAVGLVVAKIGLDFEILNAELFAALVLMAIFTTFFAPVALRFIVPYVPVTEEERLREKGTEGRFVPSGQLKLLVPAGGGPNAALGCHLAAHLCRMDGDRCVAVHVEGQARPWWKRFWRPSGPSGAEVDRYFENLKQAAGAYRPRLNLNRIPSSGTVSDTILAEAAKGYQFMVLGASGHGHPVYDPFVANLVRKSPCHVILTAGAGQGPAALAPMRRVLAVLNGTYVSDAAFDVAAAYAEAAGSHIDILFLVEGRVRNPLLPAAAVEPVGERMQDLMRITIKEQFLERFAHPERLDCQVHESESIFSGLTEALERSTYDLVVLGAENQSIVENLYLGANVESAIKAVPCALALVIPRLSVH